MPKKTENRKKLICNGIGQKKEAKYLCELFRKNGKMGIDFQNSNKKPTGLTLKK